MQVQVHLKCKHNSWYKCLQYLNKLLKCNSNKNNRKTIVKHGKFEDEYGSIILFLKNPIFNSSGINLKKTLMVIKTYVFLQDLFIVFSTQEFLPRLIMSYGFIILKHLHKMNIAFHIVMKNMKFFLFQYLSSNCENLALK